MTWTILGAIGLAFIVAGVGVLGWILAGPQGAAAGALVAAGLTLVWAAMDALKPEDA